MMLQTLEKKLYLVPGILILIPAILGMRGNISGALGSRLASALHLGLIKPERPFLGYLTPMRWNKPLSDNIWASLILNVLMSFLLGIIAYVAYILTIPQEHSLILMFQLIMISLITGILAGVILTGLTVSLAIITYAKGLDPDNVLLPSLSTVGDIITVLCLIIAVKIVV